MKKHVYSLIMVLALVVLAGTSAFAQTGDPTDPFYHINKSQHTFTITDNGNTMLWQVYSGATDVTADVDHVESSSGADSEVFTMTWAETASGMYNVQITETTSSSCQTVRKVYVFIINFDAEVYVSNATGGTLEGATNYQRCGEGTMANYGDIASAAFSQSVDIDGTGAGDLTAAIGTTHQTEVYISIEIHWNAPTTGTYSTDFDAAAVTALIDYITYNATVTFSGGAASDFISIGSFTGTPNGDLVTEATGAGTNIYTSTMTVNARWGLDQDIQVAVSDVTLYDASDVAIGTELSGNVEGNTQGVDSSTPYENTTDTQTILGAPATSIISVN